MSENPHVVSDQQFMYLLATRAIPNYPTESHRPIEEIRTLIRNLDREAILPFEGTPGPNQALLNQGVTFSEGPSAVDIDHLYASSGYGQVKGASDMDVMHEMYQLSKASGAPIDQLAYYSLKMIRNLSRAYGVPYVALPLRAEAMGRYVHASVARFGYDSVSDAAANQEYEEHQAALQVERESRQRLAAPSMAEMASARYSGSRAARTMAPRPSTRAASPPRESVSSHSTRGQ